jgi:acetylornithine deacetylase/succinyl-diaminopimelate desuccinylase-like protein
VNLGPGHTAYAHRQDELVDISALVEVYGMLERFIRGAIGEDVA